MWVSQPYLCLRYEIIWTSWIINRSQFILTAYFQSSKHVQRLVDRTVYCPGAELNCEEISHYVSWLEDLDAVKTNFFPALRNVSTQNVRPIVFVLNSGHIYLGKMVRFVLFLLSASFAYIIFKLNFIAKYVNTRCFSTGTPDDSCASLDWD